MDLGISGKTALVLGASGGLGGAIAARLAAEGANVAAVGRSADALAATAARVEAAGTNALALAWDLGDLDRMESVVAEVEGTLGPVDILVNNTGGPPPTTVSGQEAVVWRTSFDQMVLSVIMLTDRVLPGMRERRWGRILTSTSSGALAPIPNLGLSNTLRASLHAWSKTLADEVMRGDDGGRALRPSRGICRCRRVPVQRKSFVCHGLRRTRRRRPDSGSRLMRIRTVTVGDEQLACVALPDGRLARIDRVLPGAPSDLLSLIASQQLDALAAAVDTGVADAHCVDPNAQVLAPWTRPRKILGIGLNYGAHAGDLGEQAPRTSPASFIKGDHTVVGPGEPIVVLPGIGKVTAEAELGLVVGRTCYQVSVEDAMSYVAGVVPVLDQTAEAVLLENARYLTRVKNYPTFFSFGPDMITLDEVLAHAPLADLKVATIHNGAVHRKDTVSGMTFSPAELLSFHSQVMPFYPGDILSTGTPGAVGIEPGDVVACELGDELAALTNPVR